MKNVRLVVLLVFAVSVAVALYGAEKATTFEGTLVDSKCYLKDNSLTGNDHGTVKECGTLCAKGGTPAGLLTKTKKFHAVLAPSPALAPFIGQTVRINGSLHNGAILAEKVEVEKNGKWEEVKLGVMMERPAPPQQIRAVEQRVDLSGSSATCPRAGSRVAAGYWPGALFPSCEERRL